MDLLQEFRAVSMVGISVSVPVNGTACVEAHGFLDRADLRDAPAGGLSGHAAEIIRCGTLLSNVIRGAGSDGRWTPTASRRAVIVETR